MLIHPTCHSPLLKLRHITLNPIEPWAQNITNTVLASISLASFYIKRVGQLKLLYPLLFINIHKGTKYPISVHQNLQTVNINYILKDVLRGTKGLKLTKKTCGNVYGNIHISKVRHYETTLQLFRAI